MNFREHQMLELLSRGRDCFGIVAVRAEFEAEGARREEIERLLEVGYRAGLGFILKIGGCEAIRDLQEAKQLGANTIIAPMIESSYALSKYIDAIQKNYSPQEWDHTQFYFNIETLQAYKIKEELIALAQSANLTGIVFGRVDFVGSSGLTRDFLNSPEITDKVLDVAALCQASQQNFILGGGIDLEALPIILKLQQTHLTRFETRKVAFNPKELTESQIRAGLILAAEFELLWLKNKQNYYHTLYQEDVNRIALLEKRVSHLEAA